MRAPLACWRRLPRRLLAPIGGSKKIVGRLAHSAVTSVELNVQHVGRATPCRSAIAVNRVAHRTQCLARAGDVPDGLLHRSLGGPHPPFSASSVTASGQAAASVATNSATIGATRTNSSSPTITLVSRRTRGSDTGRPHDGQLFARAALTWRPSLAARSTPKASTGEHKVRCRDEKPAGFSSSPTNISILHAPDHRTQILRSFRHLRAGRVGCSPVASSMPAASLSTSRSSQTRGDRQPMLMLLPCAKTLQVQFYRSELYPAGLD